MITAKEAREKVEALKKADCEKVIKRCKEEVSHAIEQKNTPVSLKCKFILHLQRKFLVGQKNV